MDQSTFIVASLYKFVEIEDPDLLREQLLAQCQQVHLKGTLLVATEGINGTIAGRRKAIDAVLSFLRADARFADLSPHEAQCDVVPFQRLKVRVKREIVTLKVDGIDPLKEVGRYVSPGEWNALISDPQVALIDTRNDFEVRAGTFPGAINPETTSFGEFPAFVNTHLDPRTHPRVAMFCTGGIRCEKATAYMLSQGFEQVYHLKGGILTYLDEVESEESLWTGKCFVFDERRHVE